MTLIYAGEPNALKARDRAFSLTEARLAAGGDPDKKLRWMMTAVDATYAPYLVKIHAMNDERATISFVDCKTGDVLPDQVTIDLTDRELVWSQLPSTLEGWSRGTTDCAFLFLSPKIDEVTRSAKDSGGGTGKWPRGAAVTAATGELGGLAALVGQDPRLARLTAGERAQLAALLAKLEQSEDTGQPAQPHR
jgi:hypothetical protein